MRPCSTPWRESLLPAGLKTNTPMNDTGARLARWRSSAREHARRLEVRGDVLPHLAQVLEQAERGGEQLGALALGGGAPALQLGLAALALGLLPLAREQQPVGRAPVGLLRLLGTSGALGGERTDEVAGRFVGRGDLGEELALLVVPADFLDHGHGLLEVSQRELDIVGVGGGAVARVDFGERTQRLDFPELRARLACELERGLRARERFIRAPQPRERLRRDGHAGTRPPVGR